ncbi:related to SHR3-endoplasmic reticulum packaging chaperone [Sporisorium reilianum f. sp. reilianum]|uniref:Related to SHR3-endoplasmic reticulum packaging chaperone n=1 Tax=Sporisorium reilianum f. sp. reilianum TaxID=72559 RepID=A0A2N8U7T9_9BASI|nr:related to SHR3-endoplasmic reticulum packaging chaperone [Sporisorium reilianum f. sp. reilianum]
MGFRSGFVISSTSFLFGVIFIASIYDFPLLYFAELTDSAVEAAERFYLSLFNAPLAFTALLHGMMGLGVIGLIAKLHRWNEMAKYFDGASLALFVGAICMYLGVSVPNLRLIADPTNEKLVWNSAIATQRQAQLEAYNKGESTFKPADGAMTQDERVAAIRIISASNTITIVLLTGVIVLQISEWYLERQEAVDAEKRRRQQAKELVEAKKDK